MLQNKRWIIIVVIIAVVGVVIITNKKETPLPGYDASSDVRETEPETTIQVDAFSYTDETTGLTLLVPSDWTYVLKSGYATYIHTASATSVQIQVMDYYPQVNMVTQESLAEEIAGAGGELLSFQWHGNSAYEVSYILADNGRFTDYFEATTFDRNHVVRIIYTVNDEYYERMRDTIAYSMSSISWEKPFPVPDTLSLYYSSVGDFEFGRPAGWEDNFGDWLYYAMDPNSGASYTVSITESDVFYTDITQMDYVSYASNGRNNFSLNSFYSDRNTVSATATYYSGDTRMMLRQFLLASGDYEYTLTQECPAETYDIVSQTFEDLFNVFRVFAQIRTPVEEETTPSMMEQYEQAVEEAQTDIVEYVDTCIYE